MWLINACNAAVRLAATKQLSMQPAGRRKMDEVESESRGCNVVQRQLLLLLLHPPAANTAGP